MRYANAMGSICDAAFSRICVSSGGNNTVTERTVLSESLQAGLHTLKILFERNKCSSQFVHVFAEKKTQVQYPYLDRLDYTFCTLNLTPTLTLTRTLFDSVQISSSTGAYRNTRKWQYRHSCLFLPSVDHAHHFRFTNHIQILPRDHTQHKLE